MRVALAFLLLVAVLLPLIVAGCGGTKGLGNMGGTGNGNPPLPGTGAAPPPGGGGGSNPPSPPTEPPTTPNPPSSPGGPPSPPDI
jgi:hypothetical protein